jgi:hypothetical protein
VKITVKSGSSKKIFRFFFYAPPKEKPSGVFLREIMILKNTCLIQIYGIGQINTIKCKVKNVHNEYHKPLKKEIEEAYRQ